MDGQVILFTALIFSSSLLVCLAPKVMSSYTMVKKIFPSLTLVTAGFLLGVQLLELTPHILEDCHDHEGHDDHHSHEHSHGSPMLGLFVAGLSFIFLLGIDTIILKHKHCEEEEHHNHSECHGTPSKDVPASVGESERLGCCDTSAIKKTSSRTQVFIYILGISIHSFFEGLAFSSINKIGSLEIGLILHKILESFAIGVPLFTSGFDFSNGLMLAIFYSSLTPLGILISSVRKYLNQSVRSVFKGLALGSIMFMVSFEMIPTMFNHPKGNRLYGLLTLLAGYLISGIVIHLSHPH